MLHTRRDRHLTPQPPGTLLAGILRTDHLRRRRGLTPAKSAGLAEPARGQYRQARIGGPWQREPVPSASPPMNHADSRLARAPQIAVIMSHDETIRVAARRTALNRSAHTVPCRPGPAVGATCRWRGGPAFAAAE